MRHESAIIIPMSKITKGHIITQNLDGTDHLDCLYRISLKALIYNDAGQIFVVKQAARPLLQSQSAQYPYKSSP